MLLDLVHPWAHSDRVVRGDSYFASVGAAIALKTIGLRFIGVVKTAIRKFPKAYLMGLEMDQRGDMKGLVTRGRNGSPDLLAFVWVDRERRCFIASGI